MKNITLLFVLTGLFGSLGLERALAQLGPPPAPMVASPGMASAANATNRITKVVRIYNGSGSFDDAMADRLRPMLAKAFPSSMPEPTKAVPGATPALAAKTQNQTKVTEAAHE